MARQERNGGDLSEREAYYGRLLDEQEASGLSVTSFAEENDLSGATLYSWRRRLGRAKPRGGGTALVEVCVGRDEDSDGSTGRMTVVSANGVRIELEVDFDESALERLLGVLERC